MKRKSIYKRLVFLITICFNLLNSIAQGIDVFEDEIMIKEDLVYYQNQLLSGTVYSLDEKIISNSCQCTHKTTYKNGKKEGIDNYWYINGKIEEERLYKEGVAVGVHINYNKDGSINNKKIFQNGSIDSIIYYQNENIIKKEIFKLNKLIRIQYFKNKLLASEEIFNKKRTRKILYYDSGNIKQEDNYYNEKKEGLCKTYNTDGSLNDEKEYYENKIIAGGCYINNKKEGEWFRISKDGIIRTITIYHEGKLIETKEINSGYLVRNYPIHDTDIVLLYENEFENNKKIYLLRFDQNKYNYKTQLLANKIKNSILSRGHRYSNLSEISNTTIDAIIRIESISIKDKTLKYAKKRTVNGIVETYYENGYESVLKYNISVYDMSGNQLNTYIFTINPQEKFGTALLNTLISNYSKTKEDAFKRSLNHVNSHELLIDYFPIVSTISVIKDQSKTKIKKVIINKGTSDNVLDKSYYDVYNDAQTQIIGKLKIIKTTNYNSTGKVLSGGVWLKNNIDKKAYLLVKETKK